MKNTIKGALAIASVATLIGASYGCDQPDPQCSTGRGIFYVVYKNVGGGAGCADIKGDDVGVNTYSAVGDGQPDYNKASAGIETSTMSGYVLNAEAAGLGDPDPTHHPYALGNFVEEKASGGQCHIPTMVPAQQNLPEVTEDEDLGTSAQPATNVTFAWSNLAVIVKADSNGQQMTADLTYTDTGAGLTCQYKALFLYPSVDCTLYDAPPAEGGKAIKGPDGKKQIDPTACLPFANPGLEAQKGQIHATGSNINPDFPVHCDPESFHCVIDDGKALLPF